MAEPSPSEIAYEEAHINQSRQINIAVSNGICLGIAFVAVLLRFISRRLAGTINGADDWWAWIALTLFTLYIIAYSFNAHYGLGRHSILITNLKGFIISDILSALSYNTTIFAIKISFLFFYRRIFPQRWFKYALLATGIIVGSYTLAYNLVAIFQCVPIKASWDTTIHGTCVDLGTEYFVAGITNVLTDITILILPMPLVWQLQTSKTRRWLVIGTFMLGGCACIISIIRLVYVREFKGTDASWNNVPTAELSTVELGIGILSACMPAYRPLYNYFFHGKATVNSSGHRSKGNSGVIKMANIGNSWPGGHRELNSDSEDDSERLYTRFGTTTNVQSDEENGHRHHGEILVTKEFATLGVNPDSR